jgi:hypothetical protein
MSYAGVLGIGSLLTSSAELLQNSSQHHAAQDVERRQHEEEIRHMKDQHQRELHISRQTYLLSAYTDIEQYFQELNENLINGSRDAERDMVDQRNQQFQTILIAATMMFTSLLSILYQGIIPKSSMPFYFIVYSSSTTLGLMVLLFCVIQCIIITKRINTFMYRRSSDNIQHLTQAMEQTKHMMKHIRGDVFSLVQAATSTSTFLPTNTINDGPTLRKCESEHHIRKALTQLPEIELEEEWIKHEDEVYKYLERRNRINERMELLAVDLNNQFRISFQEFWLKYCKTLSDWTLIFFYLGTSLMLVEATAYMCATFVYSYRSNASAIVTVIALTLTLLICIFLAIYLRYYDKSIDDLRHRIEVDVSNRASWHERTMKLLFRRAHCNQPSIPPTQLDSEESSKDI